MIPSNRTLQNWKRTSLQQQEQLRNLPKEGMTADHLRELEWHFRLLTLINYIQDRRLLGLDSGR